MQIIISTKKILAYWKVAYNNPSKFKDQQQIPWILQIKNNTKNISWHKERG